MLTSRLLMLMSPAYPAHGMLASAPHVQVLTFLDMRG